MKDAIAKGRNGQRDVSEPQAALPEDPDLILSTHMVAKNFCNYGPWGSNTLVWPARTPGMKVVHRHGQVKHSYLQNIIFHLKVFNIEKQYNTSNLKSRFKSQILLPGCENFCSSLTSGVIPEWCFFRSSIGSLKHRRERKEGGIRFMKHCDCSGMRYKKNRLERIWQNYVDFSSTQLFC